MPIGAAARLTKKYIINDQIMFSRIKTKTKVPLNEKWGWVIDLLADDTDGGHLVPILCYAVCDMRIIVEITCIYAL